MLVEARTDLVSLLKHLPFCLVCISLQDDKDRYCIGGDVFLPFFFFSELQCCVFEEGYMTDKFHFIPTTIMALLFKQGSFVSKPF